MDQIGLETKVSYSVRLWPWNTGVPYGGRTNGEKSFREVDVGRFAETWHGSQEAVCF